MSQPNQLPFADPMILLENGQQSDRFVKRPAGDIEKLYEFLLGIHAFALHDVQRYRSESGLQLLDQAVMFAARGNMSHKPDDFVGKINWLVPAL